MSLSEITRFLAPFGLFCVCVAMLAIINWLLHPVDLGPPVPDDEPEAAILDGAAEHPHQRRKGD